MVIKTLLWVLLTTGLAEVLAEATDKLLAVALVAVEQADLTTTVAEVAKATTLADTEVVTEVTVLEVTEVLTLEAVEVAEAIIKAEVAVTVALELQSLVTLYS